MTNFASLTNWHEIIAIAAWRRIRVGIKRCGFAAIATLVSVGSPTFAQSTIRFSSPPVEYTPFEVTVTMSREGCFDTAFPLVGETHYAGTTLAVVLSQLSTPQERPTTISCGRERKFALPGLPRGRQEISVAVTEPNLPRISETISAVIDVAPISSTNTLVNFWTGTFVEFLASGGVGPPGFYLTPSRFSMFASQWNWLELGSEETNFTFKAFRVSETEPLPSSLVRLNNVNYPAPLRGTFWTPDAGLAQRLAGEWSSAPSLRLWAVGRLNQGACPIGMSPVYQTFHPKAITHRWTQSRTAYAAMLANGYSGDGPVWCAPALRGE